MIRKSKILDVKGIEQKLKRLSWQVYEKNANEREIVIIGISRRGFILAKQLSVYLQEISDIKTKVANLDLDKDNPYDKDIFLNLEVKEYSNKVVVLVDDVLNSGKTLMYSAKHFLRTPQKQLYINKLIINC